MNARTFRSSHTSTATHKQTNKQTNKHYVDHLQGAHSARGQSHKNQTEFRHRVTWKLSYNQTKKPHPPALTEELPHQPTKQRERVRMIIMTDNKKETNQKKQKGLKRKKKSPNLSMF